MSEVIDKFVVVNVKVLYRSLEVLVLDVLFSCGGKFFGFCKDCWYYWNQGLFVYCQFFEVFLRFYEVELICNEYVLMQDKNL